MSQFVLRSAWSLWGLLQRTALKRDRTRVQPGAGAEAKEGSARFWFPQVYIHPLDLAEAKDGYDRPRFDGRDKESGMASDGLLGLPNKLRVPLPPVLLSLVDVDEGLGEDETEAVGTVTPELLRWSRVCS